MVGRDAERDEHGPRREHRYDVGVADGWEGPELECEGRESAECEGGLDDVHDRCERAGTEDQVVFEG